MAGDQVICSWIVVLRDSPFRRYHVALSVCPNLETTFDGLLSADQYLRVTGDSLIWFRIRIQERRLSRTGHWRIRPTYNITIGLDVDDIPDAQPFVVTRHD